MKKSSEPVMLQNFLTKSLDDFNVTNKQFYVTYPLSDSSVPLSKEFISPPGWRNAECATFQSATKLTVCVGQCFGLNPVQGISEIDTTKLRFSIHSARSIYSIISIIAQTIFATLCFAKSLVDTDSSLTSNTSLIFYSTNAMTTILFFRIATKWPTLGHVISKIEATDPLTDNKLVHQCNMYCIVILSLALLEHILSDISGIAEALDCHSNENLYESFIAGSFPWIFSFIPYHPISGFIAQLINIQCTFNWNFSDVFVIVISLYLKSRLEQVKNRIVANSQKLMRPSFWRVMREDYTRITYLVRQVDEVISSVVFISFANNLYFICLQWLHILAGGVQVKPSCSFKNEDQRPFRGYEQTAYFVYSFAFLVCRSVAVSIVAARVHTASKQPAHALYDVPSEAYCVEIERFLDQIHGNTVALSGLQFFNVKRGLVLSIAGTIITYELVLMQFTGITPTSSPLAIG